MPITFCPNIRFSEPEQRIRSLLISSAAHLLFVILLECLPAYIGVYFVLLKINLLPSFFIFSAPLFLCLCISIKASMYTDYKCSRLNVIYNLYLEVIRQFLETRISDSGYTLFLNVPADAQDAGSSFS